MSNIGKFSRKLIYLQKSNNYVFLKHLRLIKKYFLEYCFIANGQKQRKNKKYSLR